MTKAFNHALSSKKNFFEKGIDWINLLKKVRPVWTPSHDGGNFGEFTITSEKSNQVVDFQTVFENIHALQRSKRFEFLIILDEFQEVHKVKKAEAYIRGALQSYEEKIPTIILGSKQHLLMTIFENPKAPFYSWGTTVEFHAIQEDKYHRYIEERFQRVGKTHGPDVSTYLQNKLNFIPESINKLCNFIAHSESNNIVTIEFVDHALREYVDRSRSIYEHIYSTLSANERRIVETIAKNGHVEMLTSKKFLAEIGNFSKSTISNISLRLLDSSIISQGLNHDLSKKYWVTDPFFSYFLKKYK